MVSSEREVTTPAQFMVARRCGGTPVKERGAWGRTWCGDGDDELEDGRDSPTAANRGGERGQPELEKMKPNNAHSERNL